MRYCPQGDVIVGSSGGIVGSSGAGKEGYGRNGRMANTAMLAYVPITKPLCQWMGFGGEVQQGKKSLTILLWLQA